MVTPVIERSCYAVGVKKMPADRQTRIAAITATETPAEKAARKKGVRDRRKAKTAHLSAREQRDAASAERSRQHRLDTDRQRPSLTSAVAQQFVRLLAAGVPALKALAYLAPKHDAMLTPKQRAEWLSVMCASPLVLNAQRELLGGDWESLSAERRIQVARDKFLAECAFILYRANYASAQPDERRVMSDAADRLEKYLDGVTEGDATPMQQFIEELLAQRMDTPAHPSTIVLTTDLASSKKES